MHVHVDTTIPSRVCTDKRDHAPTFMCTVSDSMNSTLPTLLLMQQVQEALAQEECQVSRHSLLAPLLLFSTCVHHLLELLGFTWYLLIVLPVLPIPQHGVCKDLLDLSPYAHPKAWWSRSHACKIVVEEFPERV